MRHLVFFFHISAIIMGFIHLTLLAALPKRGWTEALKAYARTFASALLVLLSSAVVEYAAFNGAGGLGNAAEAVLPYPIELMDTLFSPYLILITLPSLVFAMIDRLGKGDSPARRIRNGAAFLTTAIAIVMVALNALGGFLIRAFPSAAGAGTELGAAIRAYRASVHISVCYGLMFSWIIAGAIYRPWKDDKAIKRIVSACLGFLLLIVALMVLEVFSRSGRVRIPWFSNLAAKASPYGLQLPWILLVSYSIIGGVLILRRVRTGDAESRPSGGPAPTGGTGPVLASLGLSQREEEIAGLVMDGKSNKDIARALGISYSTVKNHIAAIFKKCGVGTRFELARKAAEGRRGLPEPGQALDILKK